MDYSLAELRRTVVSTAQQLNCYRQQQGYLHDGLPRGRKPSVSAEVKKKPGENQVTEVIDLTSDTEESTTSTKVKERNKRSSGFIINNSDHALHSQLAVTKLAETKASLGKSSDNNTETFVESGRDDADATPDASLQPSTKRSRSPALDSVPLKRHRHSQNGSSKSLAKVEDEHDFFQNRRPATDEEVKTFLDDLRNPDIKVSVKQELCIEQIVYNRLTSHGIYNLDLKLDRTTRTFTVTRAWMSKHFGGSANAMVSLIAPDKVAKHGYDHFLFMNLAYHPDAPKRPGCGGLMYAVAGAAALARIPPVARVFVNVMPSQWLYMGNYEIKEVESLSVAEWKKVPTKVREKWATEISTQTWARLFRIRTVIRKSSLPPGTDANEHYEQCQEDNKPYLNATPSEVLAALDNGIEPFCVFTVKPLTYDVDLQKQLIKLHRETYGAKAKKSS